jgi:hypothetical protein
MRIGRGNLNIRYKPATLPFDPQQIPRDLTWGQTWAAAVGNSRIFVCAMAYPSPHLTANHMRKDQRTEEIKKHIHHFINRQDNLLLTTLYADVTSRSLCGTKREIGNAHHDDCRVKCQLTFTWRNPFIKRDFLQYEHQACVREISLSASGQTELAFRLQPRQFGKCRNYITRPATH